MPSALSSVNHAENFPVASCLFPRALRQAVAVIYQFARSADDLADEGNAPPAVRLAALAQYRQALDQLALQQRPTATLFIALEQVVQQHTLPLKPFYDLLDAFCQDIHIHHYSTIDEVLKYCERSATPIGYLMLKLYGITDAALLSYSNAICTGLQLANFCQDVGIDWDIGRVYLPQDEIRENGVDAKNLPLAESSVEWRQLMHLQIQRARQLINSGRPLVVALQQHKNDQKGLPSSKRLAWELRMIIEGGLRILERIEAVDYQVVSRRPSLNFKDWGIILARCLYFHGRSQCLQKHE